jgi:plasmid stabilization system protein ParE
MPDRKWAIDLSPEADEDLIEIWGYLAREASERVADRQLSEIQQHLKY